MTFDMDYHYCRSEPAAMVEIYLPKRAAFQGRLYDTLTEAIRKPQLIKDHFKDPSRQDSIREFLKEYRSLSNYTCDYVEKLPQLLYGFSMYEVDGVFLGAGGGITEERTQVLRLFFKYPIPPAMRSNPDHVFWIKSFFRSPALSADEFVRRERTTESPPAELLQTLDTWINYVWFVVHGFLLYQICECVCQVSRKEAEEDRKDALPHRQEEIWVVSAWMYQVARAIDPSRAGGE
jgi:hypothetical protein